MIRLFPLFALFGCGSDAPSVDFVERGSDSPTESSTQETSDPTKGTVTKRPGSTAPGLVCSDAFQFTCDRVTDTVMLASCAPGVAAIVSGQTYADVNAAIVSAGQQVVWVCPGLHEVDQTVNGGQLSLSAIDITPGSTVLSGAGSHQILVAIDTNLSLDGLAFCDGRSTYDGGAIETHDGTLDIPCGAFVGNMAQYEGGALRIRAGDSSIGDVAFVNNYADYGGGAIQAGDWDPTILELTDSRFYDNATGYAGGAISMGSWADDTLVLNNVDMVGNAALNSGGAMALGGWGGIDVTAVGGTWDNNDGGNNAGVVAIGSRSPYGAILLDGVTLTSNTSTSLAAFDLGSALTLECIACDWGTGATDNGPTDLYGYAQGLNFGNNASFTLP